MPSLVSFPFQLYLILWTSWKSHVLTFFCPLKGDLTDAKDESKRGSEQYIEEWQEYYSILKETKVQEKTKWLDLRGNHG